MLRPRFRLCFLLVALFLVIYFTIAFFVDFAHRSKERRSSEKKVLFFLKTHKCGSTTVQNILLRFGMSRELDLALPERTNYLGNPMPFNRNLIPPDLRSPDGRYDMFVVHTRLNVSEVKAVMREGAVWVTMMRDPASLYESLFHFYHLERRFGNKSLESILNSTEILQQKARWLRPKKNKLGINQMAWDLGMDEADFDDKTKVNELVSMIETNFHLVMIAEHMEASVILLADLMKWRLEDVVFLRHLWRPRNKYLGPEEKSKLLELNSADATLYKTFLAAFRHRIEAYGVQRMEDDVRRLVHLNILLRRYCVDKTTNSGYAMTIAYKLRNMSNDTCEYMAKSELFFLEELRQERRLKLGALTNLKRLVSAAE